MLFKDFCKDIYFYFYECKSNVLRFFERLNIWRSYWKVTKKIYDFDFSGILEVEKHQILRTIKSITKFQNHVNWERDVKWMKICVNLLDIILRYDDWWDIETPEGPMLVPSSTNSGYYEIRDGYMQNLKYTYKVYVNCKNTNRFYPNLPANFNSPSLIVGLREAKAWNLYCKIRKEHLQEWWD